MIIKSRRTEKTILNFFDLLGDDENALSKAFAFVLAGHFVSNSSFVILDESKSLSAF